ncbi:polysaccharide deacetylase family protein [Falsiroseomonas oryzae]|uniref:polysaccharide deacetylase family protein n=1 Tax=Falsiroseomonas oryzae TaxID=2766473 RepID=UPI0022EB9982|nr:polysaccharide deacetylase family protein [Roseomonas sp. MO-31]
MLKSHGRFDYRGIEDRPRFRWTGGKGLALYFALNVEHYAFGEGLVEDLVPGMTQPDVLNASWREYGTRVGAWRLLRLFEAHDLPLTILLNSAMYDHAPDLVAACRALGHEISCHGRTNSEAQAGLDEAAERAMIAEATARIAREEGRPPAGWLGPWLSETERTPELLTQAGYRYLLDWCADDQPFLLRTASGPLLVLPYSQEVNDSVAIMGRQVEAAAFADMIIDQVDQLIADAADGVPLAFGIALHTNIIGQPFRRKHLARALHHIRSRADEIWIARGADIAEFVLAEPGRVA